MDKARRFPPPWTVGEMDACFFVEDAEGKKLAYCYFLTRPTLAHDGGKLDRAEALRIARNIAKLPDLLQSAKGRVSQGVPKGTDAAVARVAR